MKYELLFREYRYTKVQFGKVDIHTDRAYSERWLQPNEIPTNIMWRYNKPVWINWEHFQEMLKKYQGSPEGMKRLMNIYLWDDLHGTNLLYDYNI